MLYVRDELKVNRTEDGYLYAWLGSEDHGRPSFRLWINRAYEGKLQKKEGFWGEEEVLPLPVEGKVVVTERGNKVLRPQKGWITLILFVDSGYRGESSISPELPKEAVVIPFYEYASERGSLGVSEGLLVSVPESAFPFKVSWERTGRTYGEPTEGIALVEREGTVKELPPEDVAKLV